MRGSRGPADALDLLAPVRDELARVNRELAADLLPREQDLRPLVEHVGSYRGKQLRPALVFLAAKALGGVREPHFTVAKVVELIHTATLVHDDILDDATLRRQVQTLNAMHGNEVPVLLGDYLYATAFWLSMQLEDVTCSRVLADVVRVVCQGEITQILHRFDFDWSEPRYEQVITEKTASLYAAACRLGAHYAGADAAAVAALTEYGLELGVAFQIVDDCLDLGGEERVVGKSLGTDLQKGKLTLPLLWLLHTNGRGGGDGRDGRDGGAGLAGGLTGSGERLRQLMTGDDDHRLQRLRDEFDLDAAIGYSLERAAARIRRAQAALEPLPPSSARACLAAVGEYVLARRL